MVAPPAMKMKPASMASPTPHAQLESARAEYKKHVDFLQWSLASMLTVMDENGYDDGDGYTQKIPL